MYSLPYITTVAYNCWKTDVITFKNNVSI